MPPRNLRLTPTFFHLLLCMAEGPKHGYGMMREIEERTEGSLILGPSSLYYSLGRLEEVALIVETEVAEAEEETYGDRRRYYRLTSEGRRRLHEEVAVLERVVEHARARHVLRGSRA